LNAAGDNLYLHRMQRFDANLLFALDALLETGSVTGAAEQIGVSVPAMSRTLVRIRKLMCDPIMVQAGRGLVATPKALEMRARVHALVQEARDLTNLSVASLADAQRTFTVRTEESIIGVFASAISKAVHSKAPKVALRFISQGEEAIGPLREGIVDLDIGTIKLRGPEVKVQKLFAVRFMGVVRRGHPLANVNVTAKRYVEHEHISASRRGLAWGAIDDALAKVGLRRTVSLVVPTFSSALMIAATSDLIAAVPDYLTRSAVTLYSSYVFSLPVRTESNRISLAWHPRFDADPIHRFVRESIVKVCATGFWRTNGLERALTKRLCWSFLQDHT
jgi:DNA-binding transcriptional LysR family regulator